MAEHANDSITDIWTRISTAVSSLDPPEPPLSEGASDIDLLQLEATLLVDLPQDIQDSLRCHNGTEGVALDELPMLLDTDGIAAEYERLLAGVAQVTSGAPSDDPELVPFQTDWIPIQEYSGAWVVFDTSAESRGQLLTIRVEEATASPLGITYRELLAKAAEEVEALVPTESEVPAPADWAVFVVQNLCCNDTLELCGQALRVAKELEESIDRFSSVPRSPRQVADRLLDVLVDSECVEEVYADADEVLALLEAFNAESRKDS